MSDMAKDIKAVLESFNQPHPCAHVSERREVDGLVRYHCTKCGFTMFIPLSLEATLESRYA